MILSKVKYEIVRYEMIKLTTIIRMGGVNIKLYFCYFDWYKVIDSFTVIRKFKI